MSKKIRKTVAKFDFGHQLVKQFGLPDPVGDALYGSDRALSPAEQAAKAAESAGSEVATAEAIPTAVSDETMAAREAQRRRQLAAAGLSANVLTGPGGLSGSANTQLKSLLGS